MDTIAKTPGSVTARRVFSLAIFAYLVVWVVVFVFLSRVFGNGDAILLSLAFVPPLVIALRMLRRWPLVRRRELAYLSALVIFISGASVYVVRYWSEIGMDRGHEAYEEFVEFRRLLARDPAFRNVELSYYENLKCPYWMRGSVTSDADADRLRSIADQCRAYIAEEIDVTDGKGPASARSVRKWGWEAREDGWKRLNGATANLRSLALGSIGLTDAGLKRLEGLSNLESLVLGGNEIGDAGLAHLKGLKNLRSLDLWGTNVSDAGLEHLKGLTKLQWLDLGRTKVTSSGVKKLRQALPDCNIFP